MFSVYVLFPNKKPTKFSKSSQEHQAPIIIIISSAESSS
jgi:hypothetical protein